MRLLSRFVDPKLLRVEIGLCLMITKLGFGNGNPKQRVLYHILL